ncbi:MAG TPA: hypothetical protein VKG65_10405, partial [Terriglobales bacterium]|nr:hypothetical protein [Terriglobales bacterium]
MESTRLASFISTWPTRTGDVSINRIGVVGGQLLRRLLRCGIDAQRRLLQLGDEMLRRKQFDAALLRSGKQHIEGFDMRVEAIVFELRQHPLGIGLVVGRANIVRPRAQMLHGVAQNT